MSTKKSLSSWIIALIYFFIFIVFSSALGILYDITIVRYTFSPQGFSTQAQNWIIVATELVSILLLSIIPAYLSAKITRKYFLLKDVKRIVIWATIYSLVLHLIYFIQTILVTTINGFPIMHNYPGEIATYLFELAVFYLFTSQFLHGKTWTPKLRVLYDKKLKSWLP